MYIKNKITDTLVVKIDDDEGQGSKSSDIDLQLVEAPNRRKRKVCGLGCYKKRRITQSLSPLNFYSQRG